MGRWIGSLSNFALMFVIPVVGWWGYLSYGAKRHWFDYIALAPGPWHDPERSRLIGGLLLALALLGLYRATPRWPWLVKGACAIGLASFLLCTFFLFAFATALSGSAAMP
ncbi:MAG: hypothetical protein RXR52_22740 [Paraburkholderia sp.]